MRGLFFTLYAIPGIVTGAYAGTKNFKMSCRDSLFSNVVIYTVAGFLWWPIFIPEFIEDFKKVKD